MAKKTKLLDLIAPVELFGNSYASSCGERWSAGLLYAEVKRQKIQPERFPLRFANTSESPFDGDRMCDFIYHARRILNADYSIPIVISPQGGIVDGFHRVAHAILDGKDFVMCYRLNEMPEPDGKDEQ